MIMIARMVERSGKLLVAPTEASADDVQKVATMARQMTVAEERLNFHSFSVLFELI